MIPAVALGLGACKDKEVAKAPDAAAQATGDVAKVTPAVPTPDAPKLGAEERAAKLGFVKYLPQDTEAVVTFYNGTKIADRVKASKIWTLVEEQMGAGGAGMGAPDEEIEMPNEDMEVPEGEQEDAAAAQDAPAPEGEPADMADGEPAGPAVLFGTEVTLALGKSTGEQIGNLLTFNRRQSYFQMRGLAKAFATAVKTGDFSTVEEAVIAGGYNEEMFKDLLKDPQSGIALLEKSKLPPIYLAFRTSEADRPSAAQQIASTIESGGMMLGEMVEPITLESAGFKLQGSKVLGSKMAAQMAEGREEMEETFDAATVDQLLAVVAKKDVFVASGTVGDYVVLFIGGSADDFKLSAEIGQSLVSTDALAFGDAYASKETAALIYGQKASMDTLMASAGGIADVTDGLRDGLAGADGIGDSRDLEALFQLVSEREAALRKLAGSDSSGVIAFFDQGLKIESFGGYDTGMIDWKASNKLSHLGKSDDVLLFANVSTDAAYDEKAKAYLEALMETAYAVTMKVAESPAEGEEIAQFQEMAKMFDSKFRPDLIALWDAFGTDFTGSLGKERAVVVDLKGSAPPIPGIPQPVVDKAKVPRISFIAPVTDRAKLSGSWDKMNTTITGTLVKISEMTGTEIPMQKPMSSEKNGNTTWFFPMPFFTDDFLPSVTVGDKWFVASSSKNQALDLITSADAGGESREGFWFSMNFKALEKYADDTYKLVQENSEALMGGTMGPDEQKMAKDAISLLSDLDVLTVHSRREAGKLRSSVHFKTR